MVAVALLAVSDIDPVYDVPYAYYLLLFFASVFLYSLQRVIIFFLKENWESTTIRHAWLLRNKKLMMGQTLVTGLAAAFITLYYFPLTEFILLMLPPLGLSLAYALPLFPSKGRWIRLRDFPFVKIFLIAFVWVYLTVGVLMKFSTIPVVFMMEQVPFDLLCRGAEFLFMIVALTIPFDIRDIPYEKGKVKTIPGLIGWKNARLLSLVLLLFAFGCMLTWNAMEDVFLSPGLFAAVLWYGIAALMLSKTNPSRTEYFYSFGIDGLFVLYALLLLAAGLI